MHLIKKGVWIVLLLAVAILITPATSAVSDISASYCRDLGHTYVTQEQPDSSLKGICIIGSTECDAWDFYNGLCAPEHSLCAENGYGVDTVESPYDPYSREHAVCLIDESNLSGNPITGMATATRESASWLTGLIRWLTSYLLTGYATQEMFDNREDWEYTGEGWKRVPVSDIYEPSELCGESPEAAPPEPDISSPGIPPEGSPDGDVPYTFDWRDHDGENWITPVKNQGSCGSCWSFSAVGVVEAKTNIQYGDPDIDPDLSEDYMVSDCHTYLGYQTCCGGWKDVALAYIRDTGIPDEGCFPYSESCSCSTSCSGTCTHNTGSSCSDWQCSDRCANYDQRLWKITSRSVYSSLTDAQLMQYLVDYGPISASLGIGSTVGGSFDGDGIYRCTDDSTTNHGILVVGFNDTADYWIIKNSWGSTWNGDGYYKLGFGECALSWFVTIGDVITDFPSITLSSPVDTLTVDRTDINFTFTVDTQIDSTAACRLFIDGEPNVTNSSVDDNVLTVLRSTIGDGNHSWNVLCYENQVRAVNRSAEQRLNIDTTGPSITISSPLNNGIYLGASAALSYSLTDQSGVDSCWYADHAGNNVSLPGCGSTMMNNIPEGNHTIIVYANDTLGNEGSAQVNITVDLNPPDLNLTHPTPPDGSITDNTSITVAVNVSDNVSNIVSCSVDFGNATDRYVFGMDNGCAGRSGVCTRTFAINGSGLFSYFANAADAVGRTGASERRNITILNTPPNITSHYPEQAFVSIDEPEDQIFNVTYYDINNDPVAVIWYQDGTQVHIGDDFLFAGNYSAAGYYNITAIATDGKNRTNQTWALEVNNTNRLPEAAVSLISSDSLNRTNTTLSGSWTYTDPDSEPQADNETRWYNSTQHVGSLDNLTEVGPSFTRRDQVWTFSVRVFDGLEWSGWRNSTPMTIQNLPPVVHGIADIIVNETERVNITVDASDEDAIIFWINDSHYSLAGTSFIWDTTLTDSGTYTVLINVTDQIESSLQEISVTVTDAADFDDDGDPDFSDIDDDNDGIADTPDSVTGDAGDLDTSFPEAHIFINSSDDLTVSYDDSYTVNITDGNNATVIEFNWNFSEADLTVNFSIFYNASNSTMRVRSLDLASQGATKTVYMNKSDSSHNHVCIGDDEITMALPESCSGYTALPCGSSGRCIDLGDRIKVTGLSHSILRTFYQAASPSSGGGGGGGGGSTSTSIDIYPDTSGTTAVLSTMIDATIYIDGVPHSLDINSIGIADVLFTIDDHYYSSSLLSREQDIDVDKDARRDITVYLDSIDSDRVTMTFSIYVEPERSDLLPAGMSGSRRDRKEPEAAGQEIELRVETEEPSPEVQSTVQASTIIEEPTFFAKTSNRIISVVFMMLVILVSGIVFIYIRKPPSVAKHHRSREQEALK